MELKDNQSAVLLELDEEGEIQVNVASGDIDGMPGKICVAIARLLMEDEGFQKTVMEKADI